MTFAENEPISIRPLRFIGTDPEDLLVEHREYLGARQASSRMAASGLVDHIDHGYAQLLCRVLQFLEVQQWSPLAG